MYQHTRKISWEITGFLECIDKDSIETYVENLSYATKHRASP